MTVMKIIHFLVALSKRWRHLCSKGKEIFWLHFAIDSVVYGQFAIRYLQKEKSNDPDGNVLMYELAERALDESINIKLKNYIAQVHHRGYVSILLIVVSCIISYRDNRSREQSRKC